MQIQYISRQDSIRLLEIINKSLSCITQAQAVRLMGQLGELLPYEASASCMTRLGQDNEIKAINIVNVDYPSAYMAELIQQGLMMKDPVLIEHFKRFQVQFWADTINRQPWPDAMVNLASLADDYGFHGVWEGCGYSYGARNLRLTEASFFCFHGLKRCRRTEEILQLVIPHFHVVLKRLQHISPKTSPLTKKETEVLKWVAQGKSNWDISVILRISLRTVKFHVSNILQKLDAGNRAHAAAIAMEQGIVEVE